MIKTIVIDDDKDFADVLSAMLDAEDCDVTVANSVSTARELINECAAADAIFLDIWMNKESSLGLIDEIRNISDNIPVILMSGGGGTLSLNVITSIAKMKGVTSFLQKPIRRSKISELIKELTPGP